MLDVSDAEQRASVVKSVADKWGGIDILINNAGVVFPEAIDSPNFFESWHKSVEILLTSQVMLVKECLPYLEASDGESDSEHCLNRGFGGDKKALPPILLPRQV